MPCVPHDIIQVVAKGDGNWQKHLLRSSVPLEYEVAKIVAAEGFGVSADYSYHRVDGGVDKEFSVDVRGVKGAGGAGERGEQCLLDLLLECKYRERGTSWLFLPVPTGHSERFDSALQSIDYFSLKFVHPILSLNELRVKDCYSAVEVGTRLADDDSSGRKGRAIESHLRHGARQLQYALPSLVALRAEMAGLLPPQQTFPFFFAAIIVTNAPLIVADTTFGINAVESASEHIDVGVEVPFLLWSADLGPDFDKHCQRQLANLELVASSKHISVIEAHRRSVGEAAWMLPSALAKTIPADASRIRHLANFEKIIVANVAHLATVLRLIDKSFSTMASTLRDEPFVKW